jgi:hypothetical protein
MPTILCIVIKCWRNNKFLFVALLEKNYYVAFIHEIMSNVRGSVEFEACRFVLQLSQTIARLFNKGWYQVLLPV